MASIMLVQTNMEIQAYMAFSMLPNTIADAATITPSSASISLPMDIWGIRRSKSLATMSVPPVVAPRIKVRERPSPSHTPENTATRMGFPR